MNLKNLMGKILPVLVGLMLGAGGTMGVQKFILPAPSTKTPAAHVSQAEEVGPLLELGEFTANLQGGAFLKTKITIEVTDEKAEVLLKEREAFLIDRVYSVLADKSLVNIQTLAEREKLKKELLQSLNELADDNITDVLFVTFVYQ